MENIQNLLRKHIESSGYTIYSFANRAKINRTTLQKVLSGDRTLTREMLTQIINTLPLSPIEFKEIQKAFLIYNIGESHYRDRMFIKDFLEWNSSALFSVPGNVKIKHSLSLPDYNSDILTDSRLLAGRETLVWLLYVLLRQSDKDSPELCTYCLYNKDFFTDISNLVLLFPEKEIRLKHLFAVDKATDSNNDGVFYNLQLLTNLIPYILQNFNIVSTRYYYGNIAKYDPEGILFPYFIILEQAVILTSATFETSLYLSAPDIVLFYTKQFQQMFDVSLPFSENISPTTNFLNHMVENFTPSDMTYCIEYQPCLLLLFEHDMICRLLQKDIPYRDILIRQILLRQQQMSNQHGRFYFTRAGLDLFARNGSFMEMAPYCDHPIPVIDRIHLLNRILESNKAGIHQYILLNEREINPNSNFTLCISDPNNIIIQIKQDDGNTRFCELHKNTIYNTFLDFFTSMDVHMFSLSLEETNTYLRQLIKELQSECRK